ncbi:hypothetical protein C2845_PM03G11150 [Panicum miliaceum]|uniref:Uncharacterized protein n=1 Tax=Panicum miliaceum TaxID=4540 RepID=A0A3L6TFH7_PANMI|nr:hypothetical protein C2845_PM03G11150 [Panicum miliaceum]
MSGKSVAKMSAMPKMNEEESLLPVAVHKGKEEAAAAGKLLSAVRNYTIFLYVGFMFVTLAPMVAVKAAPVAVASAQRFLAGGYDLSVTVAFFATATLLLQAWLARVLEPSTRARLTPLAAWPMAVATWCGITFFFVNSLTFGDQNSLTSSCPHAPSGVTSLEKEEEAGCFAGRTEHLQRGHACRLQYLRLSIMFFFSFRSVRSCQAARS